MILWAGLGNPGSKYAGNRHNVGFMVIDALAGRYSSDSEKSKFSALICEAIVPTGNGNVRVLLLKPQTYMNESGRAVQKAMQFYKIPADKVYVFHDELDLAPFKLRVKFGGGIAGHNGLRSIREHIGENFYRIRLGIGHPGHKDKVHNYVLSDFSKAEQTKLPAWFDAISDAAPELANGDDERFQSDVARAMSED